MIVTFKKAFGIFMLPSDVTFWLVDLRSDEYTFKVDGVPVAVSVGSFGSIPQEQAAVDLFLSPSDRPFTGNIPTLDVALTIPDGESQPLAIAKEPGAADEIVRPHIATAFHAIRAFLESYRDCKYLRHRGDQRWIQRETILPHITEHEFRTLLFYRLVERSAGVFVGSFSEGRILTGELNSDFRTSLQASLQTTIPMHRKFIEMAWERFFEEDFAGAVLYAAIAIERMMASVLRTKLNDLNVGTASQIGKVIDDTSSRLLCTVLLGVLGIGDADLRQRLVAAFHARNEVAHGIKATVKREVAESSIASAEDFLDLFLAEGAAQHSA